jgi:aspartyl protease family protein
MLAVLLGWQPVHAADNITILGLFRDKAIVEIDGRRHTLAVGESTADGVRLIAADSEAAVLEIDGVERRFGLGERIGARYEPASSRHVVTVAPDAQGMYYVNGSINRFQVRFVVDTGASLISMNERQARRIGLNYRLEGDRASSSTASGVDPIYVVNLDRVRVGDIELRDVPAAVHRGDFPQTILLGNSFLRRISLRREGRMLELHQK